MHYQKVSAQQGVVWFTEGWRLLLRRPGLVIAMTLILFLILIGLGLIPILGMAATPVLMPLLSAGVYLTLQHLARGETADFDLLFSGFRTHTQPLLILGLLLLGAQVLFALVMMLTLGGGMMTMGMGGAPNIGAAALLMMLVFSVLVLMAYTLAVPLVALRGQDPLGAVKTSFYAVAANWAPLLIYGLIYLGLALLASVPFGLGWILLLPLTFTTLYAAYRDIFEAAPASV